MKRASEQQAPQLSGSMADPGCDPALSSLSKADLVDVVDIVDQSSRIRTREELGLLVRKLMRVLPLHAIDVRAASLDADHRITDTSSMVSVDFPNAWLREYRRKGLRSIDPVTQYLFKVDEPILWSRLRSRHQEARHRLFYQTASEYGLRDGFAYGRLFGGERGGSFISCVSDDLARHRRHEALLKVVMPHVHSAVARCVSGVGSGSALLTKREIDVLYGAMRGNTNPEIAKALSISPRAVKFHLENAIQKLGARCRTDAVVIALARGLITW